MPLPGTTPHPDSSAVDFAALKKIDPEIVAWLTIPGTNIDYPIAQHSDNDYYIHHLFTGEWNSSGCLFMDCRNDPDLFRLAYHYIWPPHGQRHHVTESDGV